MMTIIGVQIYIIIGMLIALGGIISIVKGMSNAEGSETIKEIVEGKHIKEFILLITISAIGWPVLIAITIMNKAN